jgi:hypothetical protein
MLIGITFTQRRQAQTANKKLNGEFWLGNKTQEIAGSFPMHLLFEIPANKWIH